MPTRGLINPELLTGIADAIREKNGSSARMTPAQMAQAISYLGLSDEVKQALLNCFAHVAWIDDQGQTYYDALETALYPPFDLLSISAVFEQGQTVIYDTDSLDDLKPMLTVTAHYSDGTSAEVTTYTLSGTLVEGTSTITVSYGGKTTTFSVIVSAPSYIRGYTSVGTPSISGNEFTPSSAGYIKTPQVFSPGSSSWAIQFKVKTTSSATAYQNLLRSVDGSNTAKVSVLLQHKNSANKYNWSLSSNGSSANIVDGSSSNVTISDNTTLFVELAFDGVQTYTLKTSPDGYSWTSVSTKTVASIIHSGDYIAFGGPNSSTTAYNGIIYLNTLKIYIDGEIWWRAAV